MTTASGRRCGNRTDRPCRSRPCASVRPPGTATDTHARRPVTVTASHGSGLTGGRDAALGAGVGVVVVVPVLGVPVLGVLELGTGVRVTCSPRTAVDGRGDAVSPLPWSSSALTAPTPPTPTTTSAARTGAA